MKRLPLEDFVSLKVYGSTCLFDDLRVAEEVPEYRATVPSDADADTVPSDPSDPSNTGDPGTPDDSPSVDQAQARPFAHRRAEAESIRIAMALVEGAASASSDRDAKVQQLREALQRAGGQAPTPDTPESLTKRLRALARTLDRNLAEQLRLLIRFDDAELYRRDGCRNMIVWMDAHLGIARSNACEQLRIGRALAHLPILESLFAVGQVSLSKLREITRFATTETDAEFALATLELSVAETREYCHRFRHLADRAEDAAHAEQEGHDAAEALAAQRAFERRSLTFGEPDAQTTRIVIDLPKDMGEEFKRSLEQTEDWIREGGEDSEDDAVRESVNDATTASGTNAATTAQRPTARQIRADAVVLMSRRSLAHAGEAVAMADRYRVHVNVDVRLLAQGSPAQDAMAQDAMAQGTTAQGSMALGATAHGASFGENEPLERPWIPGSGPISRATARRIASQAGFTLLATSDDGEVIGTATRPPPFSKRQLRALRARDRRCQVPGCDATRHLDGHHVLHREHGGQSTMENAALVCGNCHRLLHACARLFRVKADSRSNASRRAMCR